MSLLLISFLAVLQEVQLAPKDGFQNSIGTCKPICPCIMDGINYDHGDRWQQKGKPCTTYQCFDGYYKSIYKGCEYKGTCKTSGTSWTESCFTYQCQSSEEFTKYSLLEGGCLDRRGNCRIVGERFMENCMEYECQIVNSSCYHLVIISKGCSYRGTCKNLNSFWQDGCSVYQCVENTNSVTYQLLKNEVMYWPQGSYGMFMPKEGCPNDVERYWSTGNRFHYGNGRSATSFLFHLYGNYTRITFDHHFCMHEDVKNDVIIPRYQTYWDAGEYCIFRKSGTCPKGFKSGYIEMDDLNGLEFMQSINGSVPDGNYTKCTGFHFCCRKDGKVDNPIVLPKDDTFILFMANGSTDCQLVRGMIHTMEYFIFDDENINPQLKHYGSIPEMKCGTNNTVLFFCYYRPLTCGCEGDNGEMVKIGDKVKKGCVLYICKDFQGLRYLDIIEGGCNWNGSCVPENHTWVETQGESCRDLICKSQTEGFKTTYQVQTVRTGCINEGHCRGFGFTKRRGCYELQCMMHQTLRRPYYRLKRAGCSDGNGGCVALGATKLFGCLTYKCQREISKCGLEFLKGECQYKGKCRAVNSTWRNECDTMNCTMVRKSSKSVSFHVNVANYSCKYYGNCYDEGKTLYKSCITRKCTVDRQKKKAFMDLAKASCLVNGKCIKPNTTYNENCMTKRCYWRTDGLKHSIGSTVVTFGCRWKGQCVKEADVRQYGCVRYICRRTNIGKFSRAEMVMYDQDCRGYDGSCIALGSTTEDKACNHYKCVKKNGVPKLERFSSGCFANGLCNADRSNWTRPNSCISYGCFIKKENDKIIATVRVISAGCRVGTICRSANETWNSGCLERKCIVKKIGGGYSQSVTAKLRGCSIEGRCLEVGFKEMRNKCLLYGCVFDKTKQRPNYRLLKGACRDSDGNCRDIGEQWTQFYKPRSMCLEMTCVKESNTYRSRYKKILCVDSNGKCRQQNERGFSAKIGSKIYNNCQCVPKGMYSRIQCYG